MFSVSCKRGQVRAGTPTMAKMVRGTQIKVEVFHLI